MDPNHTQAGFIQLDLEELGIDSDQSFQVHDLLTSEHYIWSGSHNYVELNPHQVPAHVFRVYGRLHKESDFNAFSG